MWIQDCEGWNYLRRDGDLITGSNTQYSWIDIMRILDFFPNYGKYDLYLLPHKKCIDAAENSQQEIQYKWENAEQLLWDKTVQRPHGAIIATHGLPWDLKLISEDFPGLTRAVGRHRAKLANQPDF